MTPCLFAWGKPMTYTHDNDSFYESKQWRQKRAAILARDNYQCQICKRYGKLKQAVVVHHKKELSDFPELSLEGSNLISICASCHNRLHPDKANVMNQTKWKRSYV